MKKMTSLLLAGALAAAAATGASAQSDPPFGGPEDIDFAKRLWAAMADARLVGPNALKTTTYQGGTGPHTTTLTALQGMVAVGDNNGLPSSRTTSGCRKVRTSPTPTSSPGRRISAAR